MNILITGINGFVGKELFKKLNGQHLVIGLYRSGNPLSDNCYQLDLINEKEVLNFLTTYKLNKIDTIIHLASRTVQADNLDDVSVITDNMNIAKNIALLANTFQVKHFIHLSSSSVYPNVSGSFNECSIPNPSTNADCLYGLSKYNSEIILNYFLQKRDIIITHLRSSMIHGMGMNETRIIPALIKEMNEKGAVTLFGDGERFLNLISVEALSNYIDFFINHPVNDVVNVSEECITLQHLAERLIRENKRNDVKIILKPEGNKTQFKLDVSKLVNILKRENV